MSDENVIVRNQGRVFLGGPPLVKAATGEDIDAESLGGADVHCRESGVCDHYAENDTHALAIARRIVARLKPAAETRPPLGAREPHYDPAELYGAAAGQPAQALRRARGDRAAGRRFRARRVQAAVRHHAGVRLRAPRRLPGRDPRQQRRAVLRERAEGHALHRAVRARADPAAVPAEHHRLHGRAARRGRRHRQGRRQAGHRGRLRAACRSSPSSSAAATARATTPCAAAPTRRASSSSGRTRASR